MLEILGCKQQDEQHVECSFKDFKMSKPQKCPEECVEAVKPYREGLGQQEKKQYFEKLWLIGGKDPYELAL